MWGRAREVASKTSFITACSATALKRANNTLEWYIWYVICINKFCGKQNSSQHQLAGFSMNTNRLSAKREYHCECQVHNTSSTADWPQFLNETQTVNSATIEPRHTLEQWNTAETLSEDRFNSWLCVVGELKKTWISEKYKLTTQQKVVSELKCSSARRSFGNSATSCDVQPSS